ncbi:hypothetical protein HYT58_03100 [Candidatus Woesearchaeota archaeon]|nr:hypothetical protein [Candidatus Woesearchaeota archaeon]
MAKTDTAQFGTWAFYIAFVIAIIGGIVPNIGSATWAAWLLLLAGLVVGFLKVPEKNAVTFLIVGFVLIQMGNSLEMIPTLGMYISGIVGHLAKFIGAASLVVAVKALWSVKDW